MKETLVVIVLSLTMSSAVAQRASRIHRNIHPPMAQAVRARIMGGYILPVTEYGKTDHTPSVGVEVAYEIFTDNRTDWRIHWRKPVIGAAIQFANLGNNRKMGQLLSLYPYVRWQLSRSDLFIYSLKLGAGISWVSRTNETNTSPIGLIGNCTMEFHINITGRDWIIFDLGVEATNNGGFATENSTMLMPYASFGYIHRFFPYRSLVTNESERPYTKALPYTYMMNIGIEAGGLDDWQSVQAGIHFDILGKATNCWATGLGIDCEYRQQMSGDTTCITQRLRGGLSWANRFTMNRFHFIIDWGIYVYDSEKPFEYFYRYNIRNGHAWNYFRIGAGVRLYDNLYAQVNVHTNGFKVEYTSFGLSYSIPVHKHNVYNKKKKRFMSYEIWHPDQDDEGSRMSIHNYIHRPIR